MQVVKSKRKKIKQNNEVKKTKIKQKLNLVGSKRSTDNDNDLMSQKQKFNCNGAFGQTKT